MLKVKEFCQAGIALSFRPVILEIIFFSDLKGVARSTWRQASIAIKILEQ
jgi:hypothetical protein